MGLELGPLIQKHPKAAARRFTLYIKVLAETKVSAGTV
jgi:hypothetical protein